jgi:TolA-binding protein
MVRGRWMSNNDIARRLETIAHDNAHISRQAADVLSLGWQQAARARCDPASPASSKAIAPIVELAIQSGFADRMREAGPSRAISEAEVIRHSCPEARVFSESKINQVANELIAAGRIPEAIHVLEVNVQLFPKSFLAPYWLAETQLAAGDTSAAISNFRGSVANDPAMLDAIERLKSLHAWH